MNSGPSRRRPAPRGFAGGQLDRPREVERRGRAGTAARRSRGSPSCRSASPTASDHGQCEGHGKSLLRTTPASDATSRRARSGPSTGARSTITRRSGAVGARRHGTEAREERRARAPPLGHPAAEPRAAQFGTHRRRMQTRSRRRRYAAGRARIGALLARTSAAGGMLGASRASGLDSCRQFNSGTPLGRGRRAGRRGRGRWPAPAAAPPADSRSRRGRRACRTSAARRWRR